jgi:deazaflavin-dependent oxidoreductase (nitroreductase family)
VLWYLFRAPVYLYRWGLGWLFGHRCLLLTHIGRRTGRRHQTVLEVVEYRKEGPEVVVANGFGPDCDWLRNIEAKPGEEVTVGSQHFVASHRFLGEEEAMRVIQAYEYRNRFIAPIVRRGFSWLLGWQYRGGENDRRQLVRQLPLIAFRPRASRVEMTLSTRRSAGAPNCSTMNHHPGGQHHIRKGREQIWRESRELIRSRHPS